MGDTTRLSRSPTIFVVDMPTSIPMMIPIAIVRKTLQKYAK
jgi:hypothetical protein